MGLITSKCWEEGPSRCVLSILKSDSCCQLDVKEQCFIAGMWEKNTFPFRGPSNYTTISAWLIYKGCLNANYKESVVCIGDEAEQNETSVALPSSIFTGTNSQRGLNKFDNMLFLLASHMRPAERLQWKMKRCLRNNTFYYSYVFILKRPPH